MKFKVGDKVRIKLSCFGPPRSYIDGGWGEMYEYPGEEGIIISIDESRVNKIKIDFPHQKEFVTNEEFLELVEEGYTFKTFNSALDFHEVEKELSRENPIAIVTTQFEDENYVAVHGSIIKKAIICGIDVLEGFDDSTRVIFVTKRSSIQEYVDFAKRVAKQKWPRTMRGRELLKALAYSRKDALYLVILVLAINFVYWLILYIVK